MKTVVSPETVDAVEEVAGTVTVCGFAEVGSSVIGNEVVISIELVSVAVELTGTVLDCEFV